STRFGGGFEVDEVRRVDGHALHPGLEVEVRSGREPGRADLADHVTDLHRVADLHVQTGLVRVHGRDAVAVPDDHAVAVAAARPGHEHDATGGGQDRRAGGRVEVGARVQPLVVQD